MVDTLTRVERSAVMSRIRGKNTRPEIIVRRLAHSFGYRFRLHSRELPGSPDIVFPGLRKVIFVHGCFWHRHGCAQTYTPKTRLDFWVKKFTANVARDKKANLGLRRAGWKVLVIWECQTASSKRLARRLYRFLGTSAERRTVRTRRPLIRRVKPR